ncbi:hypothetical protein AWI37_12075 [Klebsiella aerogenes]|nr:hypothetical protein AWI37_12075 [Klebsiella aerogenes]
MNFTFLKGICIQKIQNINVIQRQNPYVKKWTNQIVKKIVSHVLLNKKQGRKSLKLGEKFVGHV